MAQETKPVRISEAQYNALSEIGEALNQSVPQLLSTGIDNLLDIGFSSFIPKEVKEAMKSEL